MMSVRSKGSLNPEGVESGEWRVESGEWRVEREKRAVPLNPEGVDTYVAEGGGVL